MPARQLPSVLGTLESCRPAIWQAPLFSILANQIDPSSTCKLPELRCDYYSGSQLFGRSSLVGVQHQLCERQPHQTSSSHIVYNNRRIHDAGAVCESQRTNGRWSDSERTQHMNVLELKAAFLALKSFLNNQSHKTVCLRVDNTTAVAHVNSKGGTHSPCLLPLTLALWQWCLERNIMISAQHEPGKLNIIADCNIIPIIPGPRCGLPV